ncbi:hypothetical protein MKW94_024012 [Papaver nudicaule]|uniref:RING-type E3 ubiquitin transferase n=1 Tax=Papaver nudicaule TaxID=74823 RepID=A0AA42B351_PAPNU|nr:hypothetical protein [Papaver nudicaule]
MLFSRKSSHFWLCLNFFSTISIQGQNNCPITNYQCSNVGNEPPILYPFRVKDRQGEGCGHPGFDLTCNALDRTVLKLAQSGEFLVRKIDYDNKEIRLYDQGNCLARRLQQRNLNVNLFPFKAFGYQTFNFFHCPPSATNDPPSELAGKFLGVPCLSDERNTVLYTVSSSSTSDSKMSQVFMSLGCLVKTPIAIPVPLAAVTNPYGYELIHGDLYLTWVDPNKLPVVDNPDLNEPAVKIDFLKLLKVIGPIILGLLTGIAAIVSIYYQCCQRN